LLTLKAETTPGGNVCFTPDGKRIASVYPWNLQGKLAPAEIKLWDVEKGKELLTIKTPHSSGTVSLSFAPDGKRIATAGLDEKVRVWDTEKGEELLVIEGHKGKVSGVCFSPDGKRIASVDWDAAVKVWDAEKGKEMHDLKAHTDLMRAVCFSPDGKRIATASKDQSVRVWTLDQAK
jgi:WD40 repeat protein